MFRHQEAKTSKPLFLIKVLICLLLLAASPLRADASDKESERIKGVANFLIDRANENYFYIFQNKIATNKHFECLFPETYRYARSDHLRSLLRSGGDTWKDAVEKDIQRFASSFAVGPVVSAKKRITEYTNRYENALQSASISFQGKAYPINEATRADPASPPEVQAAITVFLNLLTYQDKFARLTEGLEPTAANNRKCPDLPAVSEETRKRLSDSLKDLFEEFRADVRAVRDALRQHFEDEARRRFSEKLRTIRVGAFTGIVEALENLQDYQRRLDEALRKDSRLTQVLAVLDFLDGLERSFSEHELFDFTSSDFVRFRRYVVFFAEMADADDALTVQSLLEEVTLPPVSFGLKRTPGESDWFITSYFGGSIGRSSGNDLNDGPRTDDRAGFFVPVGIEYVHRWGDKRSLSIMFSPFDFAHPVNLEIHDRDESVSVSDIIAPGLYLTFGLKDWPLGIGLGVAKASAFESNDDNEYRTTLFIGFDMPLFAVF